MMKINEIKENIERFNVLMSDLKDVNLKHNQAIKNIVDESESLKEEVNNSIKDLKIYNNNLHKEIRNSLNNNIEQWNDENLKAISNVKNQLDSFLKTTSQENDLIIKNIKKDYIQLETELSLGIEMINNAKQLAVTLIYAQSKIRFARYIALISLFIAMMALVISII